MITEEEIKKKAEELGKKYSQPCHGMGDCEFEATQTALEILTEDDLDISPNNPTTISNNS